MIADNAADERAKANRPRPRSYEEVFTPEEAKKMGIITTCWTKMAGRKGSKNSANYVGTKSAESTEMGLNVWGILFLYGLE